MADPLRSLRSVDNLINKLGKESGSIRAFHGSPYDFDRFDASKIGTGEGAQAYGHGLYFAGSEDVANKYRTDLSDPPDIFVGGELVSQGSRLSSKSPRERALWVLNRAASKHQEPIAALREAVLDASDQFGGRDVQPIIDVLMRFKSDGVQFGPRKGKTYEVEIQHPESALLDWDTPLSKQVAGSPESLSAIADRLPGQSRQNLKELANWGDEATGEVLWNNLSSTLSDGSARRGAASAAQLLRSAGVPGIRYLDGYSRFGSGNNRNYVAFPGAEDQIRILRKYGLLAPVATGAAMEQE